MMIDANYFSSDYHLNYIFNSEEDFGLVSLFADLAMDTLLLFDESVDDSIYNCFDNYHVDYTIYSENNFGLILLFEPSATVALPLAENVDDSTFEISGSDDEPDDSPLKEIYSKQTFTSFDLLEKYLKCYSMQIGFETKIVRAEKENNVMVRKIYKCRHEGKCLPKKKLDPTQNRERASSCIECGFMLNTSYCKSTNLVHINKLDENHNHELNNSELKCHLGATVLRRILRNKFPNQDIYSQDLYNIINKYKADSQTKNDAVTLYEYLLKLQQENPEWYFKVDFKGIDNRLSKIFWISSEQKRLWARFHDV
ncbi:15479_t:CDS:2, partial [Gigaspora margarita]